MTEPTVQPSQGPNDGTSEGPPSDATVPAPPPFVPPPPFVGQPYPPAYHAAYPFAPVVKEPWVNPAKRTAVLVTSVVLALLLLGGGFVLGAASTHHRDERGFGPFGPQNAQRLGPGYGLQLPPGAPGAGFGHKHRHALGTPGTLPSGPPSPAATPTTS